MSKIPANATPLALLDKLGIKVKSLQEGDIALPDQLGAYLDKVIQGGDLDDLNQLIPGINEAVVKIGKNNPVVLLNALIASNESAEAFLQTGSETVDPEASPNFQHLTHLANYHSKQVEMIADIAAEAGLYNHGLHFEITDETKFNALLEGLSQTEGFILDEKAKEVFNDMVKDMLFVPPANFGKMPMPKLSKTLDYIEKLNSIGLTQVQDRYTQASVSSQDLINSLKELQAVYSDDRAYEAAFEKLENLVAPLHGLE